MGADNTKLMLETFQTHLNLEIESQFWGLLTTFASVILETQFSDLWKQNSILQVASSELETKVDH